jgi:hypothetical protein
MTKRELYENAISIQKKCGQGLSGIVGEMNSEIQYLLDELVEEGHLRVIHINYSYLPRDTWYFPTKGYCVFDPNEEEKRALSFVRMFLGKTVNLPYTDFIQNPDFMKAYSDWLIKNKEELDIMLNLDETYPGEDVLFSNEEIEDIKSRGWFTDNKSVKECLQESRNRVKELEEMITLNERIVTLYKQKGNSEKEIEECETSIEDTKKQIKFRKRLHNYLDGLDQKKPIQEQFIEMV